MLFCRLFFHNDIAPPVLHTITAWSQYKCTHVRKIKRYLTRLPIFQMLDMIRPSTANNINLKDLKYCKMTPVFFDTFFNLEKYLDHEQRDPFATQRETDEEGNEVCSQICVPSLCQLSDNFIFSCLTGTGSPQKNTSFLLPRREITSLWMTCEYCPFLRCFKKF